MTQRTRKRAVQEEIHDILCNTSDEDADELECEELYDSDMDTDYVVEPGELTSESEESESEIYVPCHRRIKKKRHSNISKSRCPPAIRPPAADPFNPRSPATGPSVSLEASPASGHSNMPDGTLSSPAAGPSDFLATILASPASSPSDNPTVTPSSPVAGPSDSPSVNPGNRHEQPRPHEDSDGIVSFSTGTVTSKSGYVWNMRPQVATASRTPARNIIAPFRPGPTQEASQANTPEKCFNLFFSDAIVAEIEEWTNQKIDKEAIKFAKKTSTVQRTTAEEIRALLGVLIFSGYRRDNHLSTKEMWSPTKGAPFYRAAMSEGRFSFLLTCLRFDDFNTRNERRENDKFAPIRSVWDKFIEYCEHHYIPSANLTVDEQLLAFRGRCPFRMYIPNKPAKYGLKLVLTNDVKSKYMLKGIPYLGKQGTNPREGKQVGHIFTKDLTEPYHHTNRNVTTDNWFTSVPLIQDLLHNCGMTLVGTVKGNKKEIPEVMKKKEPRMRGSTAFLFTKEITLVSYVPNTVAARKTVLLMSSMHTQQAMNESGKPEMIHYYNETKGAVDTFDQMCAQYSCSRKTQRWPLCLFFGIINTAVINSWIIHSDNMDRAGSSKLKRKMFMEDLAMELIKPSAKNRLNSQTQHRQVKAVINQVCGLNPSGIAGGTPGKSAAEMKNPKVRCSKCPSKADKKTRFRCHTCGDPICPTHYYPTCSDCV